MIDMMMGDPGGLASPSGDGIGPDPKTALFLRALLSPAGIPDNSNQSQPEQSSLMDAITRKLSEGSAPPMPPMGNVPPGVDPSMPPMPPPTNQLSNIIPPNPQGMPPSPMPQQPMPQDVPQGVGPPAPPQMMAPGISGKFQATGAYGQPMDPQVLQQLVQNPDILTQMMMGGGNGQ